MAEEVTCANPGCDQPAGIKKCSACKTTPYCSVNCQTADWPQHKEICPGHLLKMGTAYVEKSKGFDRRRNCEQILRYTNLALTKLKQLNDRSLAILEILDNALNLKFNALMLTGRKREALECATEWYTMWETNNRRNPRTVNAAFFLIQSLSHNKEYDKAHLIAGTVYEQTTHPLTNDIPEYMQQPLLAEASHCLAQATLDLTEAGGIPPEEKQKAGEEAITLARKALEIHSKLFGTESDQVAGDMRTLAGILDFFNDVNDDEVPRLYERVIAIYHRLYGGSSVDLASSEGNWGHSYIRRASRAHAAGDLDRCLANWELALPHLREAARIYRVNNHVDLADKAVMDANRVEEGIRLTRISIDRRDRARTTSGVSTRSVATAEEEEVEVDVGEDKEVGVVADKEEEEDKEEGEGEDKEEGKDNGEEERVVPGNVSAATSTLAVALAAVVVAALAIVIAALTRS